MKTQKKDRNWTTILKKGLSGVLSEMRSCAGTSKLHKSVKKTWREMLFINMLWRSIQLMGKNNALDPVS